MKKIYKFLRVSILIIYVIVIFFLMLSNEKISISHNIPRWIIPTLFFISTLYICIEYILIKIKDDQVEKEIISIVNHSFRTPLTGINWHVKELEKNIPQNEKLMFLQNINNSVNKLLNVVDALVGIKNINDISGYYFEAISIREIVEKSIIKYRDIITKKNLDFQISSFKDMPLLSVDLKKITYVIDTLIENSITYTKKNGKILIDSISDSEKLILYISDTGIGLSWLDKMKLFSKFFRSSQAQLMYPDGMGLRLYLSKQIIKRHGGKIYAKSNGTNEGSTFFIELPFQK